MQQQQQQKQKQRLRQRQQQTTAADEPSWPVQVFRRTENGWHRMQVIAASNSRSVVIQATIRHQYIALLRLQVRIRLVQEHVLEEPCCPVATNENPPAAAAVAQAAATKTLIPTTAIRRRHCLLISSQQKLRSLLLRFRDVPSCVAFCDRLVLLNPSTPMIQHADTGTDAGTDCNSTTVVANKNIQQQQQQQRMHGTIAESRQVLSYVGSLLHDPDFIQLVQHLDMALAASEDGARMLEALVLTNHGNNLSTERSTESEADGSTQ